MPAYTNAKQVIPHLFQEIMRNQADFAILRDGVVIDLNEARRLLSEMADFRRAAEKALAWNTDKGNTAR